MGESLLDRFKAASRPTIAGCKVARVLAALKPAERADLVAALADYPRVTHKAIANVLTEIGHQISDDPVGKHRRGECACGRAG